MSSPPSGTSSDPSLSSSPGRWTRTSCATYYENNFHQQHPWTAPTKVSATGFSSTITTQNSPHTRFKRFLTPWHPIASAIGRRIPPDLNPIEYVWPQLQRIVSRKKSKNFKQLKKTIRRAWSNLDFKQIRKFTSSMPARFNVLRAAHGVGTGY